MGDVASLGIRYTSSGAQQARSDAKGVSLGLKDIVTAGKAVIGVYAGLGGPGGFGGVAASVLVAVLTFKTLRTVLLSIGSLIGSKILKLLGLAAAFERVKAAVIGFGINAVNWVRRTLLGIGPINRGVNRLKDRLAGVSTAAGKVTNAMGVTRRASKFLFIGGLLLLGLFAIVGVFGIIIPILSNFGFSMAQVQAITQATAAEMVQMTDVAAKLGATTEFTAAQAAGGLKFLGQAGFSATEAVAALPAVLDLATAASLELANAADIASNIMSGFGIHATKAGEVADLLAAAASSSNTNVEQLGAAMSFAAPIARALGIDIAETAAVIGKLSDAGIQGERAGTGLRRLLASLSNPSAEASAVLKDLGLSVQQLNPSVRPLVDIITELAAAGLTAEQAFVLFGDEGVSAVLALTGQVGSLAILREELRHTEGAATDMAEIMRDTLKGDIDSLKSAFQGLIIEVGRAGLTDLLRGLIQIFTALTRGLGNMVRGFREGTTAVRDFFNELIYGHDPSLQLERDILRHTDAAKELILQLEKNMNASDAHKMSVLSEAQAHVDAAHAMAEAAETTAVVSKQYDHLTSMIADRERIIADLESSMESGGALTKRALGEQLKGHREGLERLKEKLSEYAGEQTTVVEVTDKAIVQMAAMQAGIDALGNSIGKSTQVVYDHAGALAELREAAVTSLVDSALNDARDSSITFTEALGALNARVNEFTPEQFQHAVRSLQENLGGNEFAAVGDAIRGVRNEAVDFAKAYNVLLTRFGEGGLELEDFKLALIDLQEKYGAMEHKLVGSAIRQVEQDTVDLEKAINILNLRLALGTIDATTHAKAMDNLRTSYDKGYAATKKLEQEMVKLLAPTVSYQEKLAALEATLEKHPELAEQAAMAQSHLRDEFLATQTSLEAGIERGIRGMADSFNDLATTAEGAVKRGFGAAEDALVEFTTTGKLEIENLVNSVIADFARIAIRQNITGPLFSALASGLSGAFGGAGPSATPVPPAVAGLGPFREGGEVGGVGTGTSDSNLIFASKGEFIVNSAATKAYQPFLEAINRAPKFREGGLISGSQIPKRMVAGQEPSVDVTIIDQRGADDPPVETRFTPRGPGGKPQLQVIVRKSVDGDIRSGRHDKAMEARYGLKPSVRSA